MTLVGESHELGPLVSGRAPPYAKKRDGARFAQFGPSRLDDRDVLQDRGIVIAFDKTNESNTRSE